MAEWPVKLVESVEEISQGEVSPGGEVLATWAKIRAADGEPDPKAAIWIICPRCDTLGHCPRKESPTYREVAAWTITEEGGLTMRPSILCNSSARTDGAGGRCGGHYWLTDGVLREV